MKTEDLQKIFDNMSEKIGTENLALISDDITNIIKENDISNAEIKTKDEQIENLQTKYNKILETNGNLMQQIKMGEEPRQKEKEHEEKEKQFNMKDAFDERGYFIK